MTKVLVSACLLGRACRFDGRDKKTPVLMEALAKAGVEAVPFCPEEEGGLGTPRPACRIQGGDGRDVVDGRARVLDDEGKDVTAAFLEGARKAVAKALEEGCEVAYLKERSPSCGVAQVYGRDGPIQGCGVTTALLERSGVAPISVD